jgi:hypothetical protein
MLDISWFKNRVDICHLFRAARNILQAHVTTNNIANLEMFLIYLILWTCTNIRKILGAS